MCGIAGFVGLGDKQLLKKMCDIIAYRGPNDAGYHVSRDVSLGNRRLSIIDVAGGRQPIYNEDGSVVIVFNGEIYNYKGVKAELERKGHRFKTNTDTEAIVHAYEEYGERCVERFNGMFAFVIWDDNKKMLFAARDRLGEKPFYYTLVDGVFVFASEIKSLLLFPGIRRAINENALDKFLSLRYCPGNETMVKGVYKLEPGHTLSFFKGVMQTKKYWELVISSAKNNTENHYKKLFLDALEDSVKIRLMSEVPLGIYLSGGLDSSAITALASKNYDGAINTFSVGFESETQNEFGYARLVADKFGTNHTEIMVGNQDFYQLPSIVWYNDEPLGDPTIIPTFFMSKATKKYATVVLTGEGADELFSGYFHEKAMMLANRYLGKTRTISKLYPSLLKLVPSFVLNKMFEYPSSLGDAGRTRVAKYLKNIGNRDKMYASFVENLSLEDKTCALSGKPAAAVAEDTHEFFSPFFTGKAELSQQMLLVDTKMWLPDYILLRLDRMTMANSIEGRVPYLDHRLMEISAKTPQKFKLSGLTDKYILRKAMTGILPDEILTRKKRPFITPVNVWGEEGLRDVFERLFGKGTKGTLFNNSEVSKLSNNYNRSKLIVGRKMFSLVVAEMWKRIFIDSEPSKWGDNPEKVAFG